MPSQLFIRPRTLRPGQRSSLWAVERSLLSGIATLRWLAWAWTLAAVAVTWDQLARPGLAMVLVVAAFALSVWLTVQLRRRPLSLLAPFPVVAELCCAGALVVGDGFAYRSGHVFGPSQTLGLIWALGAVLSAGVAFGEAGGAAAGVLIGVARIGDAMANNVHHVSGDNVLAIFSTGLVYGAVGTVVGYITRLLRRARQQVAVAQAREEVARTLHDGVLQALAVIVRRTKEPQIARIAREQERELRDYLFSVNHAEDVNADLLVGLRTAVARFESNFDARAQLLVPDDLPPLPAHTVEALTGAVGELLTNAGKHGKAASVVIYCEPREPAGVFCSVRDDGQGFDPSSAREGVGLSRSVRARITEVGGEVKVKSAPDQGTEVCIWVQ